MPSTAHDLMNYMRIYSRLVTSRKSMHRTRQGEVRYDCHHILPRCLTRERSKGQDSSDDRESNLVLLTLKEHYLAHRLLSKLYPNSKGCQLAFVYMARVGKTTSKGYVLAMSRVRELNRACEFRIAKTRLHLLSWNAKQTAAGTHPLKRLDVIAKSTATRSLRNAERKAIGEYLQSAEARAESSKRFSKFNAAPEQKQAMLVRNTEQATCEHCGVTGAKQAMRRWHWVNCLENPDNIGLTRKQIRESNAND